MAKRGKSMDLPPPSLIKKGVRNVKMPRDSAVPQFSRR
jgi:hypothetical protein